MVVLPAPLLPKPDFKTTGRSGSIAEKMRHGASLYRQGDVIGALAAYDSALQMRPDDAHLHRTRGLLLGELDRYEGALAEFDHLLAESPTSADLLLLRGMGLYKLSRYKEGLRVLEEGVLVSPKNPELQAMRGYTLDALDRREEALAAFNESLGLEHNPHVAEAKRAILDSYLWSLVEEGFASWSGGKPKGSKNPVKITPGPPVSDYIVEERERLRGQ